MLQGLNLISSKEANQLKFIDGMNLFLECLESEKSLPGNENPIDLQRFKIDYYI